MDYFFPLNISTQSRYFIHFLKLKKYFNLHVFIYIINQPFHILSANQIFIFPQKSALPLKLLSSLNIHDPLLCYLCQNSRILTCTISLPGKKSPFLSFSWIYAPAVPRMAPYHTKDLTTKNSRILALCDCLGPPKSLYPGKSFSLQH